MAAPKYLKRYLRVQGDEMPALSKITEKISVEFDPEMGLEGLRSIHNASIKEYRKLRESLDIEAMDALAYADSSDRLRLYTESFLEIPKASPSLLDLKIAIVGKMLRNCTCCGWNCGVNREIGEKGFCKLTDVSYYASEFLHMGEEPNLCPRTRSFFSGCVFACVYCQNWDISTCPDCGTRVEPRKLAKLIDLRRLHGAKKT